MNRLFSARYAVLRHTRHPQKPDHFDLVLEIKVADNPEEIALDKFEIFSEKIEPGSDIPLVYFGRVRRRYLWFEGEMRNNRGTITRVSQGTYAAQNNLIRFIGGLEATFQTDFQRVLKQNKEYHLQWKR